MADLVLNPEFIKIHDKAVPVFFSKGEDAPLHVGWAFHNQSFSLEAIHHPNDDSVNIYVTWDNKDSMMGSVEDWHDAKRELETLLKEMN